MGIEVQRRRGRGRPKRKWFDVRDDIREKGLFGGGGGECPLELRTSSNIEPIKVGPR